MLAAFSVFFSPQFSFKFFLFFIKVCFIENGLFHIDVNSIGSFRYLADVKQIEIFTNQPNLRLKKIHFPYYAYQFIKLSNNDLIFKIPNYQIMRTDSSLRPKGYCTFAFSPTIISIACNEQFVYFLSIDGLLTKFNYQFLEFFSYQFDSLFEPPNFLL